MSVGGCRQSRDVAVGRYVTLAAGPPQPMQPLISADDIHRRVRELAADISRDHPLGVHLVGVLKGACIFLADLARAIDVDVTIDFIAVSSYGSSTRSSGQVQLLKDLDIALEG